MTFDEQMSWVEEQHGFPAALEDFHQRRCAWLFALGLERELAGTPLAVVAGSCGKASTARMLAYIVRALLDAAGDSRPVGLGTKPPLQETLDGNRERYQLFEAGASSPRWIEPEEFSELAAELRTVVNVLPERLGQPAAYDLRYWLLGKFFARRQVAFGIVEANIGFRLDPASVFPRPTLALLTPVGNDHAAQLTADGAPAWLQALGDRAGPAWHKAGALPESAEIVVGRQTPEVMAAVERLVGRKVLSFGHDYEVSEVVSAIDGTSFLLRIDGEELAIKLGIVGGFQADNAAQAAAGAWELWRQGKLPGDRRQLKSAVVEGLRRADTPGRMQLFAKSPVTFLSLATGYVKVDALMTALGELLSSHHPEAGLVVCLTFLDRVYEVRRSFERILSVPGLKKIVLTSYFDDDQNRDLSPEVMASWSSEPDKVEICEEPRQAVEQARAHAHPERDVVLLLGNGLCHSLELF